jgi:hypothetical protein
LLDSTLGVLSPGCRCVCVGVMEHRVEARHALTTHTHLTGCVDVCASVANLWGCMCSQLPGSLHAGCGASGVCISGASCMFCWGCLQGVGVLCRHWRGSFGAACVGLCSKFGALVLRSTDMRSSVFICGMACVQRVCAFAPPGCLCLYVFGVLMCPGRRLVRPRCGLVRS